MTRNVEPVRLVILRIKARRSTNKRRARVGSDLSPVSVVKLDELRVGRQRRPAGVGKYDSDRDRVA